ncbi:hypothetical protein [Neobacillus terrae]|uniref:hypothetical protein n=1 Tax=Neobacillus terrae TaxID=3034837 RepID=UPI00140BD36C|nr:hypothetical protein [Neobacillus terrae]
MVFYLGNGHTQVKESAETSKMNSIKAEGYDLITPVNITNTDNYESISPVKKGKVNTSEAFLTLQA